MSTRQTLKHFVAVCFKTCYTNKVIITKNKPFLCKAIFAPVLIYVYSDKWPLPTHTGVSALADCISALIEPESNEC